LPTCHIKTAARTDFTGKCGLLFSKLTEKIFWHRFNGKRHFRQRMLARPASQALAFKLKKWQVYLAKRESLFDKAQQAGRSSRRVLLQNS
jgi:hypothetical protein